MFDTKRGFYVLRFHITLTLTSDCNLLCTAFHTNGYGLFKIKIIFNKTRPFFNRSLKIVLTQFSEHLLNIILFLSSELT